MTEPLGIEEVRHVARLARLALSDEELETCREQLATIIDYVDRLRKLDVDDVEPLAHPLPLVNRLDDDAVEPPLSVEAVRANAPAMEGDHIAVPRVIDAGDGA